MLLWHLAERWGRVGRDGVILSKRLTHSVLADLASRARTASVEAKIHGKAGSPADAICEVAAEVGADLIIVGNKGMKGVRRVLGSVARVPRGL